MMFWQKTARLCLTQSSIKHNKCFVCAVLAGTRHKDHWCSKRGQRQCQVPLQPGEVLRPSLQQWPCKKNFLISFNMKWSASLKANQTLCIQLCNFCFTTGIDGGCDPRSDQCHQDDSQYFSLLQHIRKDYIAFCQGRAGCCCTQCDNDEVDYIVINNGIRQSWLHAVWILSSFNPEICHVHVFMDEWNDTLKTFIVCVLMALLH